MEHFSMWLSTLGVIFAIIDPFGYVPLFISMTKNDSPERRKQMLLRACATAFLVLAFFTFFGSLLLRFFGISVGALQITGGLILLVIGFDMVRVLPMSAKISSEEEHEAIEKEDISIIPLAIPMLSGPASMASVVVLASKSQTIFDHLAIVASILVTLVVTYLILRSANRILARVGVTGLHVVTRVMGLLLCAMAIQYIINGYRSV